jgi:predicted ATPase/DNA-binding CsgD family transcriptional regulator
MSAFQTNQWVESFSSRELEILQLLSNRLSNREIAEKLHLSIETIKWYNKQMFMKLGVNNRTQAANKAEELNLLGSEQIAPMQEKLRFSGNLPTQLSSYIGRKKEISEIKELLKNNRLVVLTGAGGSGKTRLSLHVAEELQNRYSDGVWLVELANVLESSMVLQTIANVLDISDSAESNIGDVLKRTLSRKHMLLLMDNLEHLLDSGTLLAELLASAPHLSILGTSRERLHISGEQEYPVSPLSLPDSNSRWTSEELKNVEAIALFILRARAVNPGLSLDEEALQHLARICMRLDGLPLAIELCAPMVKVFPLNVIAERIENNLEAIPEGPRDLPARQQTLIKTIQWSYELLKEDEKRLFERMAVFNGGGTLAAIEFVCGEGISGNIANLLSALVNKNLVQARERWDGEIHFSLLETIRHYNRERLIPKGELESLSELHADYFTKLAERARDEFSTPKHKYWFLHLKVEQDNIRSAMKWTLQNNDPELSIRLAPALYEYWNYYGFARECLRWNKTVLENQEGASPALLAQVLKATGNLFNHINEFESGKALLNQALRIFQKLNDERNEAWALTYFGFAHIDQQEDLPIGIEFSTKGFEIFKKLNDLGGMAHALNVLGELYRVQGDILNAKKCYQICLDLTQESGEKIREAIQYANLGVIAYEEKEYQLAENLIKQGLVIFLELDGRLGMSYHLAGLAGPTLALGKPLRAARILGASAAGLQSMKNTFQLADQSLMDQFSKETNAALDEESFKKAFEEGQRMTIYEAVTYALNNDVLTE